MLGREQWNPRVPYLSKAPMPRMRLEKPPVVERILTLQFLPVPEFDLIHIGLWGERIRERFPLFSRQPLLSHITESFPFRHEPSRLQFGVGAIPSIPRCVFAKDGSEYGRLHQLQVDRFAMNWRRDHDHSYMKFDEVSKYFLEFFAEFEEFCESRNLTRPVLDLCEVIYVNRIGCPKGDLSQRWREVFVGADLVSASENILPNPTFLTHNAVYDFHDTRGRLRIEASAGVHDEQPVIYVKVIGRATMGKELNACERLKQSHDWVVDGFQAVTTESIRVNEWGQH